MSNIPRAREILRKSLNASQPEMRIAMHRALRLMNRRSPDFRHRKQYRKLTKDEAKRVRKLRRQGASYQDLVMRFRTNSGRISDVLNPKQKRRGLKPV